MAIINAVSSKGKKKETRYDGHDQAGNVYRDQENYDSQDLKYYRIFLTKALKHG
jgi:hypothetical protein